MVILNAFLCLLVVVADCVGSEVGEQGAVTLQEAEAIHSFLSAKARLHGLELSYEGALAVQSNCGLEKHTRIGVWVFSVRIDELAQVIMTVLIEPTKEEREASIVVVMGSRRLYVVRSKAGDAWMTDRHTRIETILAP